MDGSLIVIILALFALATILFGTKYILLQSIPTNIEFVSTTLEEFPRANFTDFSQLTGSVESLGFTLISQHTLQFDGQSTRPVFIRLFANSQLQCFAEVYQVVSEYTQPSTVRLTISSIFHQGWTYETMNHNLDSEASIKLSHPGSIWSCHPSLSVPDLLQVHLTQRQQIIKERGLTLTGDLSTESFLTSVNKAIWDQADALKQRRALDILKDAFRKPSTKWLGRY